MPFATNKGIINFGEHNFDDYFNRNQTTIEGLTKYKLITTCIISLTIIIIAVLTISFLAKRRKLLYSAEAESELDEEQGALVTEGTEADAYKKRSKDASTQRSLLQSLRT